MAIRQIEKYRDQTELTSLLLGSTQRTSTVIGCQELELLVRQEIVPTEMPLTVKSVIENIGYRNYYKRDASQKQTTGNTKAEPLEQRPHTETGTDRH